MWLTRSRIQASAPAAGLEFRQMDDSEAIQRCFDEIARLNEAVRALRRQVEESHAPLGGSEDVGQVITSLEQLHEVVRSQQENIIALDAKTKKLQRMLAEHQAQDRRDREKLEDDGHAIRPYHVNPDI